MVSLQLKATQKQYVFTRISAGKLVIRKSHLIPDGSLSVFCGCEKDLNDEALELSSRGHEICLVPKEGKIPIT